MFWLFARYFVESIGSVWIMLSMALIPWFVLLYFCFVSGVCHSVVWVVVMLYESPRRQPG